MKNVAAIILAAGEGKRMKSKTSKILHEIAGKPMILRTLHNLRGSGIGEIVVVANTNNKNHLEVFLPSNVGIAVQEEQKGTADAAEVGLKKINRSVGIVLIANGDDSAFYEPETIKRVIKQHIETNSVLTFLSVKVDNPSGLGRVKKSDGKVLGVIEEKEATAEQKKINEINAGLYVFEKSWLKDNLNKIKKSTVTGEKYLVDLIKIAHDQGDMVKTHQLTDRGQWHGINTQEELAAASSKVEKRIHIMGIAGAGASAVAGIAKESGLEVGGCDINPQSSYTKNSNLKILKGHNPSHIHNVGALVVSPAIKKSRYGNREIDEAKKQNIPTMTWQQFQGKFLQNNKFVIAVAGGYGKSTTTAMVSQVLIDNSLNPTCEIGATVISWGKNFKVGKSKYYVSEADEYNDNFLNYKPDIAVILNISWDHPDYFKNKKTLASSYQKFINNIKSGGYLVIGDDKNIDELAKKARKDIKVVKVENFGSQNLSIIGKFREKNANIALTVAKILNIDISKAKRSVQNFKGVKRRLEYKGSVSDVKIYDDYAVQPFTLMTTANALQEKYEKKKIVLVFEPHTFSRINTFFDDFISSFKKTNAQSIFVTDTFAAREKGDKQKLSKELAKAIGKKATYTRSVEQTANFIKKNIKDFDIILSMGAGDVYKIYDYLKK